MSDPIATSDDLGMFLGSTVDDDRADLILGLAQSLCETIVSPITAAALPVILDVAARCYVNASSAHTTTIGSASVSYGGVRASSGFGGLTLSRANKADLRRLAGRSGAFSIDPVSPNAMTDLNPWNYDGATTTEF